MEKNERVTDLLQRPEFKQWVQHPTAESDFYWKNWLEHHPDQQEDVLMAKEFLLKLRFNEGKLSLEETDSLLHNIISQSEQISPPTIRRFTYMKYAAVVVLALCMGILFWNISEEQVAEEQLSEMSVSKSNPKGQRSVIRLKDGTKVHLNANSTLRYSQNFGLSNRIVELEGEAYFAVAKDLQKPFTVKSGNISTTALGTEFNVNTTGEDSYRITLLEGKVKVEHATSNDSPLILLPDQYVDYNDENGFSSITDSPNNDQILWVSGILKFEDTPLTEVIKQLENWYGVEITVKGDSDGIYYSGKFKDEYLTNILESMSFSLGLDYTMQNENVQLKLKKI